MAIIHGTEVLWVVWTLLIMLSGTTQYPECDQQSESTLDCCMVSQGTLRCRQAVCPDGFYSASTCNSSANSAEDNMGTTMPAAPTNTSTQIPSEETTAGLPMFEISSPHGETTSQKTSLAMRTTLLDYLNASTSVTAETSKNSFQVYCCQCHPTCLTCSGKGPEDCLSCAQGYEWVSTNTTKRCIIIGRTAESSASVVGVLLGILLPSLMLVLSVVFIYAVCKKLKVKRQSPPISGSLTDSIPTCETSGTNRSINEDGKVFFVGGPKSFRQQTMLLTMNALQYSPSVVNLTRYSSDSTILCVENDCKTPAAVQPQRVSQTKCSWYERLFNLFPTAAICLPLKGIPRREPRRRSAATFNEFFLSDADVHSQSMPEEPLYTEVRDTDEPTHANVHTARSCIMGSGRKSKSYRTTSGLNRTSLSPGNFEIANISDNSDLDPMCGETSGYTSAWISSPPDNLGSCCSLSVKSASDYYISDSFLSFPIISPCWEFSAEFSTTGGVLKAQNSTVCLEVTQGAVEAEHVVTIHGALSADFSKVYDTLPLPEDEVIVTPVAEYFAGSDFQFQKRVRIILPHFLSAKPPDGVIHAYEFHTEMGRAVCCSLDLLDMEDVNEPERSSTPDSFFYCRANEIHVFTNHFSGYFCTVCEKACMDFVKPPELKLQARAKHVLRCNGKREVIVRLDLWDNRLSFADFQKQTDISREDRQMVLEVERILKTVDASTDVGTIEVGASFIPSEHQTSWWDHVKVGGMYECPVDQTVSLRDLYPCRRGKLHYTMRWKLRDITEIPPQEEFECGIRVGYVRRQISEDRVNHDDDEMPMVFMKSPAPVNLSLRRAMVLDEDHPDTAKSRAQTTHSYQPELKATPAEQPEETHVKRLDSLPSSPEYSRSSNDRRTHNLETSTSDVCSVTPSENSSANGFSFHHVRSIKNMAFYIQGIDSREERIADTLLLAAQTPRAGFTQTAIQGERDSLQTFDQHCNISFPTPASDQ